MIPHALRQNKNFTSLLHQAMQLGDLFADTESITSDSSRKVIKEINIILHTYLNETFLRSGHIYTPYFNSYQYDTLAEIRLQKRTMVDAQKYEQASKLRDKEKKELEADWVQPFNAFIRLMSWIEDPVRFYCVCSYFILHYQDLYAYNLSALKSDLESLCTKKLLLMSYYHIMDIDKPIYELHLKRWQQQLPSLISKLILA